MKIITLFIYLIFISGTGLQPIFAQAMNNIGKGVIHWRGSRFITQFGIDLLNNTNPSETATRWFHETEEILNSLFLRQN